MITRHLLNQPRSTGDAPFTFVQLSDLHLQRVGEHERHIAAAIRSLHPDVLLVTGDAIDNRHRLAELSAFLDLLDPALTTYAILGNWERYCGVQLDRLTAVYAAHHARLLVNESVVHKHNGVEVLITGLDDLVTGHPRYGAAIQHVEPHHYHLVLAHCPAQRDVLLEHDEFGAHMPSCILSGHTHGGQVNLFGFCPWRPLGSGRYVSGWYRDVAPALYVSRGLGTVDLPIRFGAAPEVAHFTWFL